MRYIRYLVNQDIIGLHTSLTQLTRRTLQETASAILNDDFLYQQQQLLHLLCLFVVVSHVVEE